MRVRCAVAAFVLFACAQAEAQTSWQPGASPLDMSLRFTGLFRQFNFYSTASDKNSLDYRYRTYAFSSGATFRYGQNVSSYVFGSYMGASDKIFLHGGTIMKI